MREKKKHSLLPKAPNFYNYILYNIRRKNGKGQSGSM